MVSASISGGSPSNDTARWLATIGDDLAAKLTQAGFGDFIPRRESATLGASLKTYIEGREAEVTPGTIANFRQLERKLVEYFGADRDLRTITEGDADDWRQHLAKTYAEASISKYIKRARQVFKSATRKVLIERNPVVDVRGGSESNDSRKHFISRDITEKVLEACPDAEWRLIVALAGYGGVRTPSETLGLRLNDVDWANDRFTVTSPKTKKQGKPWRVVPLFPELRPYFEDAAELAPKDAEFFINRYRSKNANLRAQFNRILKRAGVTPWPRLFQNLRASRETELANEYPLHVVTAWLGNTPSVAAKHYLQITDGHFAQASAQDASTGGATGGAIKCELGAQQGVLSVSHRDGQQVTKLRPTSEVTSASAVFANVFDADRVTPTGLELLHEKSEKTKGSLPKRTECGALLAQQTLIDADLRDVVAAWRTFPETTKVAVLSIVRGARTHSAKGSDP